MRDWNFLKRYRYENRNKRGMVHNEPKVRWCMGLLLVSALLLSAVCRELPAGSSVQAATEAPDVDGNVADGEEAEIEEEVDETAGLLEEENGRISFWEWNKVTFDNWMDYLMDPEAFRTNENGSKYPLWSKLNKNQFQPCMFVRYSKNDGEPHGFISTYADEKHVYRGSDQSFPSEVGTVPDKVSVYMKDYLGNMDETKSIFLLQDEDGNSVDSKYLKQDRFYTTGGTLGVFICKCTQVSLSQVYTNGKLDWEYVPQVEIALSRPSMKNNPEDESYRDYGLGRFKDYFLFLGIAKSGSNYGETYLYLNDDEKHLNDEEFNNAFMDRWTLYPYDDKNMQYETTSPFWTIFGFSGHAYDASKYKYDYGRSNLIVNSGWMAAPNYALELGRDIDYYATWGGGEKKLYFLNDKLQSNGDDYRYQLYVGRQRVFATVKGEGGDEVSGRGGSYTIKKNQLKIIKEATYTKADGSTGHAEGIVIPETSTIIVEEGGVLSVEGNLINNGTIINKGGTIIIKDGGCISPFGDTEEGKISNIGGQIIVMPKGKLFCLEEEISPKSALSMVASDTSAAGLTNFGLTVLTHAELDGNSKIDNRNGGTLLAAHKRTNNSVLFYEAKVTGSGDNTEVEGIGKIDESYDGSIRGVTTDITPTVTNEKKATFVYKISGRDYSKAKDGSGGFKIFTPEY